MQLLGQNYLKCVTLIIDEEEEEEDEQSGKREWGKQNLDKLAKDKLAAAAASEKTKQRPTSALRRTETEQLMVQNRTGRRRSGKVAAGWAVKVERPCAQMAVKYCWLVIKYTQSWTRCLANLLFMMPLAKGNYYCHFCCVFRFWGHPHCHCLANWAPPFCSTITTSAKGKAQILNLNLNNMAASSFPKDIHVSVVHRRYTN